MDKELLLTFSSLFSDCFIVPLFLTISHTVFLYELIICLVLALILSLFFVLIIDFAL